MRGGAFFNGKEGRDDFRNTIFPIYLRFIKSKESKTLLYETFLSISPTPSLANP